MSMSNTYKTTQFVIIDQIGEGGGGGESAVQEQDQDDPPRTAMEGANDVDADTNTKRIHLVLSSAPLLSGSSLTACQNADDSSCSGGVAAVAAYARYVAGANTNDDKTLIIPQFDFTSPFIQQHPLRWDTNRLVLQDLLGWKLFVARSWFLNTGLRDAERNVEGLQSANWPLVMSNVAVPSTNSWYHYVRGVYLDEETNLAVISIVDEIDVGTGLHYSQVDSAKTMLDYVQTINTQQGCGHPNTPSLYDLYLKQQQQHQQSNNNMTQTTSGNNNSKCWIPIIVADLVSYNNNNTLLEELSEYHNPPALYLDYGGFNPTLSETPQQVGSQNVWALGFRTSSRFFQHLELELVHPQQGNLGFSNVTFNKTDITGPLPPEIRDELYDSHIATLRQYADETIANDPIVGYSQHDFPVAKADGLVRCEAGECEHGNLFTDAIRWHTQADFAFTNSGAYHGNGFEAGPIKVSNLWEILPFANTLCTGMMTGISMFQLFNFSTSSATFSGADTVAGGDLLQVSGVKVTYNTELPPNNRMVDLQIWNETAQEYQPVERLQLYTFASDSYNCLFNDPFNRLTGSLLTIPGEIPGQVNQDLEQEVVASFLSQLEQPYDATISGRLVNDTSITTPLTSFIQKEEECPPGTNYWLEEMKTCFKCPHIHGVSLTTTTSDVDSTSIILEGVSGDPSVDTSAVTVHNKEDFAVDIRLKSLPQFLFYTGTMSQMSNQQLTTIEAGTSMTIPFGASAQDYSEGSALGELTIEVVSSKFGNTNGMGGAGGGSGAIFAGCLGDDLTMEAQLRVLPPSQLNQLGHIRIAGWIMTTVVMMTALGFAIWCLYNRRHHVVRTMQPFFLIMICSGVFIMGSALIPLSFDDEIASEIGVDMACMSIPWLLSIGFTVSFSALFSKLWRINRLWKIKGLRRAVVKEQDVLTPFAILLSCNFIVLLTWTLVDPLRYERVAIDGEEWNTFGTCNCEDSTNEAIFFAVMGVINFGALCMACYQAYEARNLPEDFSEAGYLGMAIFSWFQIGIVGVPVLYLIDDTNTNAKYFVTICLIVGMCLSLLLWIFVPLVRQWWVKGVEASERSGNVYVSGVNPDFDPASLTRSKIRSTATNGSNFPSTPPRSPRNSFRLPSHAEEVSLGSFAEDEESEEGGFATTATTTFSAIEQEQQVAINYLNAQLNEERKQRQIQQTEIDQIREELERMKATASSASVQEVGQVQQEQSEIDRLRQSLKAAASAGQIVTQ